MAIKTSTGLRNSMLVTDSFKGIMDGCFLDIYAGSVPATADASVSGHTKLCRVSLEGGVTGLTFEATATSGVLAKTAAETWEGDNLTTGTATFYRLVTAADDNTASTTFPRVQGTVGLVGADLNLSSVNLTEAAPQAIDQYVIALPSF